MNTTAIDPPRDRPTPLTPILAFTFLNSLGTGVVTAGLFFIAKEAADFGPAQNFGLGLMFGLIYIPSALVIGPALRAAARRSHRFSTRRVLVAIMLTLGLIYWIPLTLSWLAGPTAVTISIWGLMAVNGVLNGALWPITESYLSGGRRDRALRQATGRFNVVWAFAMVAMAWSMAPLLGSHPLWILAGMGGVHFLCLPLLACFPREPARHLDDVPHDARPPSYIALLRVFRVLLPVSFVVISTIEPYLPHLLEALGLKTHWETPVASAWMVSRVGAFIVLERWHGWHGKYGLVFVAAASMVIGFAGAALAPTAQGAFGDTWGIAMMLAGLGCLGIGLGVIYAAALYYAMEVGDAEVDAGGTHEALIGIGYAAGPAGGLIILGAHGFDREASIASPLIALVSVIVVAGVACAFWAAWHGRRGHIGATSENERH